MQTLPKRHPLEHAPARNQAAHEAESRARKHEADAHDRSGSGGVQRPARMTASPKRSGERQLRCRKTEKRGHRKEVVHCSRAGRSDRRIGRARRVAAHRVGNEHPSSDEARARRAYKHRPDSTPGARPRIGRHTHRASNVKATGDQKLIVWRRPPGPNTPVNSPGAFRVVFRLLAPSTMNVITKRASYRPALQETLRQPLTRPSGQAGVPHCQSCS
jgi:hypothetical protein